MIIFHFPDGSKISTENVVLAGKWARIYCRYQGAKVEAQGEDLVSISNALEGFIFKVYTPPAAPAEVASAEVIPATKRGKK